MSSSTGKTGRCTRKKLYIIPIEWASYPAGTLDCVVYSAVKEHYHHYKTTKGASITIGDVSANAELFKDFIWMRKESDQTQNPLSSEYSVALIDNYACKHK
nr:BV-like protein [Cotesia vestalis bracovirus]